MQAGSQTRQRCQAGMFRQARVETRRTRNKQRLGKNRCNENRWLTCQIRQTGTERQETGIYTLGIISNTWRGWRQSQGQVNQIRVMYILQTPASGASLLLYNGLPTYSNNDWHIFIKNVILIYLFILFQPSTRYTATQAGWSFHWFGCQRCDQVVQSFCCI